MGDSSSAAGGRNNIGLQAGSALGEYRLEKQFETGEAGQVFLARHATTGTRYRLRVLAIPVYLDAEARMLYLGYFQRQANRLSALQHPGILPLLLYGTHEGIPYLAYQEAPAESLSKHLAQHGPMDVRRAGAYLDQLTAALEYGHQQGILHQNLNTENIFIKQDGNLVVADFGVLHLLEQGGISRSDHAPVTKRDPLFGMNEASSPAPEQVAGEPVDTPADVYALGAVLSRMLTGHRVFRGNTLAEIAQQHRSASIPPLNTWRRDLPPALDGVFVRAMAKDPHYRFAHPGELANAYHQIVAPSDNGRQPFALPPAPALAPLKEARFAPPGQKRKQAPAFAPMPRRKVLTYLVAGGSAAAAITIVSIVGIHLSQSNTPTAVSTTTTTGGSTPGSNSASPSGGSTATTQTQQGKVLAHVSDIPLNSDKQFPLTSSSNPGLLIHLQDNRFVAFDSTCTHAGCAVNYNPQDHLLDCPCHGAIFDPSKNGSVVQGPATTPLTAIPISVNADGTITTSAS